MRRFAGVYRKIERRLEQWKQYRLEAAAVIDRPSQLQESTVELPLLTELGPSPADPFSSAKVLFIVRACFFSLFFLSPPPPPPNLCFIFCSRSVKTSVFV